MQVKISQSQDCPKQQNEIITCISNQAAWSVCIHQTCTKLNPFICSKKNCSCYQNHVQCRSMAFSQLNALIQELNKAQQKKQQTLQIEVDNLYNQYIDELSDQRQRIINKIKSGKYIYNGINKNNKQKQQLKRKINIKQINNGSQVYQFIKRKQQNKLNLQQNKKHLNILSQTINKLKTYSQKFKLQHINQNQSIINSILFKNYSNIQNQNNCYCHPSSKYIFIPNSYDVQILTKFTDHSNLIIQKLEESLKTQKIQSDNPSKYQFYQYLFPYVQKMPSYSNFAAYLKCQNQQELSIYFLFNTSMKTSMQISIQQLFQERQLYNFFVATTKLPLYKFCQKCYPERENKYDQLWSKYIIEKTMLILLKSLVQIQILQNIDKWNSNGRLQQKSQIKELNKNEVNLLSLSIILRKISIILKKQQNKQSSIKTLLTKISYLVIKKMINLKLKLYLNDQQIYYLIQNQIKQKVKEQKINKNNQKFNQEKQLINYSNQKVKQQNQKEKQSIFNKKLKQYIQKVKKIPNKDELQYLINSGYNNSYQKTIKRYQKLQQYLQPVEQNNFTPNSLLLQLQKKIFYLQKQFIMNQFQLGKRKLTLINKKTKLKIISPPLNSQFYSQFNQNNSLEDNYIIQDIQQVKKVNYNYPRIVNGWLVM